MSEYFIVIRPWGNGKSASVEFSDNTPCILADKIRQVIMDFYNGQD